MTRGLRWRVLTLQVGLILVFGAVSGFLLWGSNFSHSQVNEQLSAQQITFPAANSSAITALPASDAAAMNQYGGQQLTNGDQAKVYSDSFIGVHLNEIGGGKTYAQLSAAAQANPNDAKLAGEVATVFKGTALRGMLLDAYSWWTVGTVAFYGAIAMLVATAGVVFALVFELVRWRSSVRGKVGSKTSPSRRSQPAHA